jgi:hypothetical protein
MPVRSSTPDRGNARYADCANRSAGFREETAIPKQLRAGIVSLTAAFLIQPIRREGVMRTNLAIAVVLLGCLASAAWADPTTAPPPPNPQVNIQQPEPGLPMPRPQLKRPDPPVKTAAVKKSSRPERHRRSKRRPDRPKQVVQRPSVEAKAKSSPVEAKAKRPSVEAKAKSPSVEAKAKTPVPHRASPAKDPKTAASEATSAVQPAQEKPDAPEHQLRRALPEVLATKKPPVAAAPAPESMTAPEQEQPAAADTHAPEAGAEQQQTATASPQPTAKDQEERTLWWTHEGSPAVVRFRDCIAAFAVRNIGKNNSTTWADLLIRAAEGDCRQPFNDMAHTLSARLGAEATEPVIRSLIETTFLPAARKAVSSTQRVAGGKSDPAPSAPPPMH